MYPVLFQIGGIKVFTYGVFVALGFILAIHLAVSLARKSGFETEAVWDIGLCGIIAGLLGGRLVYVAFNLDYFLLKPMEIFKVFRGGLVFYGALCFAIMAVLIYMKIKKLDMRVYADICAPAIAFGHAIGRVGCFMYGCCFGKPTGCSWGVEFPATSLPSFTYGAHVLIYPVQLYESLGLMVISYILYKLYQKPHRDGQIFIAYLILYPLLRFFMEFLRGDNKPFIGPLTVSQLISVFLILTALILSVWTARKNMLESIPR